ncbi:NIPSNAP family protein [Tumebacillus sp. DT12]|uniref:NIPSNAP family protein n=1 Tax=Tumebacillus lacus TaxID=2995335 RepID=A0ABT3WX25_9BACL|nr:NIPSNAP family protein [Tumebacillus lacus]MCX7569220.1 NIPSNAP family protein [Tumebacillus lacus]
MIYEHRTYTCEPGARDKLRDRFDRHAKHLFRRHNIRVIAFYENLQHETGEFVYICEFENEEAMERSWENFSSDPEWIECKRITQQDGPLIREIDSKVLVASEFFPFRYE